MTTICPNCLRPLRSNAKYCGYCGASLIPNTHVDTTTMQATALQSNVVEENASAPAQSKPRSKRNIRRVILIVLIILLVLVLLVAFLAHYWPSIIPNISTFFSSLLPK